MGKARKSTKRLRDKVTRTRSTGRKRDVEYGQSRKDRRAASKQENPEHGGSSTTSLPPTEGSKRTGRTWSFGPDDEG